MEWTRYDIFCSESRVMDANKRIEYRRRGSSLRFDNLPVYRGKVYTDDVGRYSRFLFGIGCTVKTVASGNGDESDINQQTELATLQSKQQ